MLDPCLTMFWSHLALQWAAEEMAVHEEPATRHENLSSDPQHHVKGGCDLWALRDLKQHWLAGLPNG